MFMLRAGSTQLEADAQIQRQKRIVESARVGWPPPMSGGHFGVPACCYTADHRRLRPQWMWAKGIRSSCSRINLHDLMLDGIHRRPLC